MGRSFPPWSTTHCAHYSQYSTYICQRHSMRRAYYGHGSAILAYHTNLTAPKCVFWPSHGNAFIATSMFQRYKILQKSFVMECLDAAKWSHVYSHIIFVIFHKTLNPIKVNLTRICENFAVRQPVWQPVCEQTYYFTH